MTYEEVVAILEEDGFTRVTLEESEDLNLAQAGLDHAVKSVTFGATNEFTAKKKFPHDIRVTITYHTLKRLPLPFNTSEAKNLQAEEAETRLADAGFVNVRTEPVYDLITGWLTKEGSISEITVGGETKFARNDKVRPDVEIVITYHTFPKKEGK